MKQICSKSIIFKLALSEFMKKKRNSILTIVAIILTATLLSAVFTIGMSLADSMENMMLKSSGRSSQVCFQYLTDEEAQRIAKHSLIESYGVSRLVGGAKIGEAQNLLCEVRTSDENYAEYSYSKSTTGRLPQSENEVSVVSWMLDEMGLQHELGEMISLEIDMGRYKETVELVLCGFWEGNKNLQPYGTAYISETLAQKLLKGVNIEQDSRNQGYYGLVQLEANLTCATSTLREGVNEIISDLGLNYEKISPLINTGYLDSSIDGEMVVAALLLVAVIFISGYLLIYNTIYISIIKNINFYGRLKSIGATRKQIRQLVNMNGLILSCVGIPIGLFMGYWLGVYLLPRVIGITVADTVSVRLNPISFVLSAILALVAVLCGCHKPANIAGKVSPVEAMRFTRQNNKSKKILVILSISIGLILFNIVYTYVNSFDINKYLQTYIYGDYVIANNGYFDAAMKYESDGSLDEKTLEQIAGLDEMKSVEKVYFEDGYSEINGEMVRGQIYGMDDYWCSILKENVVEGQFDYDKFLSGDYVLVGYDWDIKGEKLYNIGDTIQFKFEKDPQTEVVYEVMAKINAAKINALSVQYITMPGFSVYLPAGEMSEKLSEPNVLLATAMTREGTDTSLRQQVKKIIDQNPNIDFRSRDDYIKEMKDENSQIAVIGFVLCAVIYLIGILNFINTCMTDVYSRNHELAIMKAIGMTNKQVVKMLIWESMKYILGVLGVFVTIGNLLCYVIVSGASSGSAAYTYRFTWVPLILCFSVTIIIAICIPARAYKNITKESVVERLRGCE